MPTRLGQNFLTDETVVDKIIASANLQADDFVVEIGPGKGVLTKELAKHCQAVKSIEIDESLFEILLPEIKKFENVELIRGDILKINLPEIVDNKKYKVIANIPYYITSPIIRSFLEQENQPREIILMIQKEVAERIVAKPGKMSILAVAVQYYADAEILFTVSKNSFDPVPQVDSAVIKIVPRKKFARDIDQKFFRLIRAGFSAKRKTLANNLSSSFHLGKNEVETKLKTAGLSPAVRAQELSIENWKELMKLF